MLSLQKRVRKITQKLNLANSAELCCLDLASEVGEVAKEVLELTNYGRRKHIFNPDLKRELGDAFYSLISLANIYDIDLEKQLDISLEKYYQREEIRDINHRKLDLEPIVLSKNFLCLNSIAGCRNNCVYCYKHNWNFKNKFRPNLLFPAKNILKEVVSHRYFHPNIPLSIHNSATDPFQKGVIKTTFEIADGLEKMGLKNIVAFITKEYISPEIIKKLENYHNIRPVVFVTYSYLNGKYEKLIDDCRLKSMQNLASSKLKKILYYRPIIAGVNDSEEIVQKIVNLGNQYFDAIVRSALKLDLNILENFAKNGISIPKDYDVGINLHDSIKSLLPKSRERIDRVLAKGKTPFFKKTSCAISFLFKKADYNTQWIRPEFYCSQACPKAQKNRCQIAKFRKPKAEEVQKLLKHLNLKAKFVITENSVILQSKRKFYSDIKFLRMALNFPVLVRVGKQKMTAEEYDRKYVNIDRKEVKKQIKKLGYQ